MISSSRCTFPWLLASQDVWVLVTQAAPATFSSKLPCVPHIDMRTQPGCPMRRNSLMRATLPSDIVNNADSVLNTLCQMFTSDLKMPSSAWSTTPWHDTCVMCAPVTDTIWLTECVG